MLQSSLEALQHLSVSSGEILTAISSKPDVSQKIYCSTLSGNFSPKTNTFSAKNIPKTYRVHI